MAQETELGTEATEEVTASEDLTAPTETLAPESSEQETSEQPDETQPKTEAPAFDPDAEHEIEFGGKQHTVKGKDLQAVLENQQALKERETALNRDYTQKMQGLSKERKSIESAFGRMPEPQELQALSKVWQAYFSDPNTAKVVDAILSGVPLETVLGNAPTQDKSSATPEVAGLKSEIHQLKSQLSQFMSGSEREKQEAQLDAGKRIFDSWREAKQKSGQTVPEEIIDAVLETAGVLRRRFPDWDSNKALDEALRRETIDQVEKTTTQKVLLKADNAKKAPTIKITPKSANKPLSETGYAEIFRTAM